MGSNGQQLCHLIFPQCRKIYLLSTKNWNVKTSQENFQSQEGLKHEQLHIYKYLYAIINNSAESFISKYTIKKKQHITTQQ